MTMRRKSSGLDARTVEFSAHIVDEELAHIRSFGVTDEDRVSQFLGVTTEALNKRRERAATSNN
ncbi:hypothetical protein ACIGO9_28910 [Nocardia asteroides]|uniref:hypothetical protein n=1 Tax=Nocardia asteroides TaxID=1824 RepID=UPI0037C87541